MDVLAPARSCSSGSAAQILVSSSSSTQAMSEHGGKATFQIRSSLGDHSRRRIVEM